MSESTCERHSKEPQPDEVLTAATKWRQANNNFWTDASAAAFAQSIQAEARQEIEKLEQERDDAVTIARRGIIERLRSWIGRVGHEDYYKASAKLLELEQQLAEARAQLAAAEAALLKIASFDTTKETGARNIAAHLLRKSQEIAKAQPAGALRAFVLELLPRGLGFPSAAEIQLFDEIRENLDKALEPK